MIRARFVATQKHLARLIRQPGRCGIGSAAGGGRTGRPALLRAIDADPFALARALNWYARDFKPEPEEWFDF
jgi:hypothetical protein